MYKTAMVYGSLYIIYTYIIIFILFYLVYKERVGGIKNTSTAPLEFLQWWAGEAGEKDIVDS